MTYHDLSLFISGHNGWIFIGVILSVSGRSPVRIPNFVEVCVHRQEFAMFVMVDD